VAQVLAWVYQLRAAVAAGRGMAADAPDVSVPPELDPANPAAGVAR
jgi:flagellar biosynthesis protein FlhB